MDLPVDFSVSHCEGLILCALSTGGPVGIDAEKLGDLDAGDFRLYLNAAERAWAGHSARRFYSVWTRKEAVSKAAGSRGLRDLAGVDTTSARHRAMFNGRLWRTSRVPVGRGHMAHLALADAATSLCIDHISAQALEGAHLPTERNHPSAPCPVPVVVRAPFTLS